MAFSYPRGFLSSYHDGRRNFNDVLLTNGSLQVECLMGKLSSNDDDPKLISDAIFVASSLFGSFKQFVRLNCAKSTATDSSFRAIGSLIRCVTDDIDIVPEISFKKESGHNELMSETDRLNYKEIPSREGSELKRKMLDLVDKDDFKIETANVIRHILKNSSEGIGGLITILDFFFGYDHRAVVDKKEIIDALSMKSINSVKPI